MIDGIQHIAVVSDDPRRRALLQSFLRDLKGSVVDATNETDALHLVQALKPKVLVIDHPLTKPTSEQLCRSVKHDAANRGTMVLLVGNMGSLQFDAQALIESGIDDCCTPVADEVRKRVEILLQFP